MKRKYYTGIGSRNTPLKIRPTIHDIARTMDKAGFILRSGGARGADSFFEEAHRGDKEIYLPFKNYNGHPSNLYGPSNASAAAHKVLLEAYPSAASLSERHLSFHVRNVFQVLGPDLRVPSSMVICWWDHPEDASAIAVAGAYRIPVINLAEDPGNAWRSIEKILEYT